MRERSIVTIIEKKGANYPKDKMFWCPDQEYIELIGIYDHYIDNNDVFAMLRELFFEMGMDKDNYGKESWNPLGDKLIEEGQSILIKPNMVIEQNKGNGGVECLYTNPSLVAALIPYVWKALGGKGKIVVADAPIQSCEFETLCESAGYYDSAWYNLFGIDNHNDMLDRLRGAQGHQHEQNPQLAAERLSGFYHSDNEQGRLNVLALP